MGKSATILAPRGTPTQRDGAMKRTIAILSLSALIAVPALAALNVGDRAPDFTTEASLAGKPFKYSLADALKNGPVVLYFYPAAFTPAAPSRPTTSLRQLTSLRRSVPASSASRTIRSTS